MVNRNEEFRVNAISLTQRRRGRDAFASFQLYEPRNTQNTRKSVWNKKSLFCVFRAFSGSADAAVFRLARTLGMDDFEDAVVAASAKLSGCDYVITRNVQDCCL